eukprot:Tamp_21084.p1 GENE.Tamp_21084~~Tamp_21084.p1  ORF type:complete len:243 (+),score=95.29 Tamp_21084:106-729(+)
MSPEGIEKCLNALSSRSASCEDYLKIVKACAGDLDDGACSRARDDGEEMLCLIVRTKPADLSAGCQAALPKKEEAKGLKKYWADGKRELDESELSQLDEEDKDIYTGWHTRKFKGKKTDKSRERDYAVKTAKKERVAKLMTETATAAMAGADEPSVKAALAIVKEEFAKAVKEDLTKTLTKNTFSKSELEKIAKAAVKAAKAAKSDL